MGVSKNNGIPKSSILIGFSIINHPLCGTPIFWKRPYDNGRIQTFFRNDDTCCGNTMWEKYGSSSTFCCYSISSRLPKPFPPPKKKKKNTRLATQIKLHPFQNVEKKNIWMFPKIVGFPPKSSILIRVFHDFHHPFWGFSPYVLETAILNTKCQGVYDGRDQGPEGHHEPLKGRGIKNPIESLPWKRRCFKHQLSLLESS